MKKLLILISATVSFAGFAADEPYVEFTGAQSVDTGYRVTSNTTIVADFQMTDTDTVQQCVWSAGGNLGHRLYVAGDKNWSWACHNDYSSGFVNTGKRVDGDRVVATVDGFNKVVTLEKNGVVWYERTNTWANQIPEGVTSDNTLKIGSRYAMNASSNWLHASMKLYSFKIYEAGVLKRDYVPATRDGIVGLYDEVDGGFAYDTRLPADDSHNLGSGGPLMTVNDPYLESTGGTGLNARMVICADMRAEVDFAYTDTNAQQRVFGWNSRPSFYISSQDTLAFNVGRDGNYYYHSIAADANRHTAIVDYRNKTLEVRTGNAVSWSGTITQDIAPEAGKPTPVALFANTEDATYTGLKFKHPAKVKIYRAKFYRAGVLVHDYRPCVKGDVPGMKDHVDGAFVCGENIEAFRVGGDNVEYIPDDGYVELTGNNQESGTKKWIDTGYAPGPDTRFVFDYALATNYGGAASGNSGEWWYLGCYTPASGSLPAERMNFVANGSNTFRWRTGSDDWKVANSEVAAPTAQRGIRRRIVYDSAAKTYSLVTAGYTNFTVTASTSISRRFARSLRIGGNTDSPTPISYAPVRIYGLKIYEGDTLLHDFQPMVTNGVPGLLDVQTGSFKVNAESNVPHLGCGGLIATDAGSKDAYLEFTGAQSIDTGLCPTKNSAVVADFQLTCTVNSPQQFVWSSDNEMCTRLYTAYNPKNFNWLCHKGGEGGVSTGIPVDTLRMTATVDGYNKVVTLVRNGETISSYTGAWKANDGTGTANMRIGSRFAEGNDGWCFTYMKLYSFKVFESGELVRDYVPLVQNGVAGLYDKVNRKFVTDSIGNVPMKIGGIGTAVSPLSDVSVGQGKTVTLNGTTSGAIGYQWYLNGKAVAGATNETYTVEYRKGKPDTDAVQVVPYFDVFRERTSGDPMSVTVTYSKPGMILIVL